MKILLFRGYGLISTLIRWQTWGKYAHVAVQLEDESVIEAWPRYGVHRKKQTDWRGVDAFYVSMTPHQEYLAQAFLGSQCGKPYDFVGCLRFLPRDGKSILNPLEQKKWFCSDLVAAAFDFAGVPLLRGLSHQKYSPSMIGYSPRLIGPIWVPVG